MCRPLPGTIFLRTQNTHGRGITEGFVGDTQVVSNIDSFSNIMPIFDSCALRFAGRALEIQDLRRVGAGLARFCSATEFRRIRA
jgi:hypothetical protein